MAPTVHVEATFQSFDTGVATTDLAVWVASVPVQRLLKHLTGLLNAGLRSAHLPDDLVVIEQGPRDAPLAVIDLQAAVEIRADGVTLTDFAIADAAVRPKGHRARVRAAAARLWCRCRLAVRRPHRRSVPQVRDPHTRSTAHVSPASAVLPSALARSPPRETQQVVADADESTQGDKVMRS